MSGQFNTGESKLKAQMSIVFEAQMSYRFTGKKAQTSCARPIVVKVMCHLVSCGELSNWQSYNIFFFDIGVPDEFCDE